MNGVYIRRNGPDDINGCSVLLYYEHMDAPWTMMLKEVRGSPIASASPNVLFRDRARTRRPPATHCANAGSAACRSDPRKRCASVGE